MIRNPPPNAGDEGSVPGLRRSPGKGNGSPQKAWEISWTEEPGGLQSTGSQRVRHDSATKQQQLSSYYVSKFWTRLTYISSDQRATLKH